MSWPHDEKEPPSRERGMERPPKKRAVKRVTNRQQRKVKGTLDGRCHVYLIRIPEESDQERALVAFESVREAVHCVQEDEFLVTGEHLKVLRKAGVPFEDITEPAANHGEEAAG
jgi:hypothetical protein